MASAIAIADAQQQYLGTHDIGALSIRAWWSGDYELLNLELSGVLSARGCAEVLAFAAGIDALRPYAVVVTDARRALVCVSAEELSTTSTSAMRAKPWRPGAFIVSPENEEEVGRICERMAEFGIERRVFTNPREALVWARRMASRPRGQKVRAAAVAHVDGRAASDARRRA